MSLVVNVSGPITITVTQEIDLSALTAKLDELESVITNEAAQVATAIADLQAKIDAGLATPEEMARFDTLTAKVAAIFTPPEPPPVEPTPEA